MLRDGKSTPEFVEKMLAELAVLSQAEFRSGSSAVFTRPIGEFLHYYESSGTTGDPVAAPKALDDLAANTINIGEMWRRVLAGVDSYADVEVPLLRAVEELIDFVTA